MGPNDKRMKRPEGQLPKPLVTSPGMVGGVRPPPQGKPLPLNTITTPAPAPAPGTPGRATGTLAKMRRL